MLFTYVIIIFFLYVQVEKSWEIEKGFNIIKNYSKSRKGKKKYDRNEIMKIQKKGGLLNEYE